MDRTRFIVGAIYLGLWFTVSVSADEGPLAGLPSRPGAHIEKVRALRDNEWLELGPPAADPKWDRAGGRSWTSEMPFAPELRGAFLFGEGVHGYTKPDGHYMDDLGAYRYKLPADGVNP